MPDDNRDHDRDRDDAGDASPIEGPKRELSVHSARILEAIDELRRLEFEKRKRPISTPEFHRLAEDITAKSRDVFRIAMEQEAVGDEAPTGDVTIEDVARRQDEAS